MEFHIFYVSVRRLERVIEKLLKKSRFKGYTLQRKKGEAEFIIPFNDCDDPGSIRLRKQEKSKTKLIIYYPSYPLRQIAHTNLAFHLHQDAARIHSENCPPMELIFPIETPEGRRYFVFNLNTFLYYKKQLFDFVGMLVEVIGKDKYTPEGREVALSLATGDWGRKALDLWFQGKKPEDIAKNVGVKTKTLRNSISILRERCKREIGFDPIPYQKEFRQYSGYPGS